MPNWCGNNLIVEGKPKDVKEFKDKAKSDDTALKLNKLYPMPKELEGTKAPVDQPDEELIKKCGTDNWYDWRVNNWGTKWDIEATLLNDKSDYLNYVFDSAWSPPVEWLEKVSKDFSKLKFTLDYEEPGMGFQGKTKAYNGKVSNRTWEMDFDDEWSE